MRPAARAERLAQWDRGAGFAAIRAAWLERAHALGKTIHVALSEGDREGRFETVDDRGRLVLRRDDGTAEVVGGRRAARTGEGLRSWPNRASSFLRRSAGWARSA